MRKIFNVLIGIALLVLLAHGINAIPKITDKAWPFNFDQKIKTQAGLFGLGGHFNSGPFFANVLSKKIYKDSTGTTRFEPLYIYLYYWFWKGRTDKPFETDSTYKDWLTTLKGSSCSINGLNDPTGSAAAVAAKPYITNDIFTLLKSDTNKNMYLNLIGLKILRDEKTPDSSLPASMSSSSVIYPTTKEALLAYFKWDEIDATKLTIKDILKGTLFETLKISPDDILAATYPKVLSDITKLLTEHKENISHCMVGEEISIIEKTIEALNTLLKNEKNTLIKEKINTEIKILNEDKKNREKKEGTPDSEAKKKNTNLALEASKENDKISDTLNNLKKVLPTTIKELGNALQTIKKEFEDSVTKLNELKNKITDKNYKEDIDTFIKDLGTLKTEATEAIEAARTEKVGAEINTLFVSLQENINKLTTHGAFTHDVSSMRNEFFKKIDELADLGGYQDKVSFKSTISHPVNLLFAGHEISLLQPELTTSLASLGASDDLTTLTNQKNSIANLINEIKAKFKLASYTTDVNDVDFKKIKEDFETAADELGSKKGKEIQDKIDLAIKEKEHNEQLVKAKEFATTKKFKETVLDKLTGTTLKELETDLDTITKKLLTLKEEFTQEFNKPNYKNVTEPEKNNFIKTELTDTAAKKIKEIQDKIDLLKAPIGDHDEQFLKANKFAVDKNFEANVLDKLTGTTLKELEKDRDTINKALLEWTNDFTKEFEKYKDVTPDEKNNIIKTKLTNKANHEKKNIENNIVNTYVTNKALQQKLTSYIIGGGSTGAIELIKKLDAKTHKEVLEIISRLETYGSEIPDVAREKLGLVDKDSKKIFETLAHALQSIAATK
ncbi:TPA: hypothetical protein DDZ86_02935 [Candidatus Dependentiae bacterium]|nr:MAG: hypothetical protein UW09_C0001G0058 [candidate division TM6 bacterium GW2011_GWF2_43_87]HBL98575.1 hypothetical protein [Candidatus Dependentiae bacterium]